MTLSSPASIAAIIDHTLLRPDATAADIDRLCAEAITHGFAAVCVNPYWVAHAARQLAGHTSVVAAVVGFPLGATTPDVKAYEADRVVADGAREVDMVVNIGALKTGTFGIVEREIDLVVGLCRLHAARVKVILETALLTAAEKEWVCAAATRAGAAFVKTSTGFGPPGATAADVALLRRAVGRDLGVKASGGIRDLNRIHELVAAGATRIGTSTGVRILEEAARHV